MMAREQELTFCRWLRSGFGLLARSAYNVFTVETVDVKETVTPQLVSDPVMLGTLELFRKNFRVENVTTVEEVVKSHFSFGRFFKVLAVAGGGASILYGGIKIYRNYKKKPFFTVKPDGDKITVMEAGHGKVVNESVLSGSPLVQGTQPKFQFSIAVPHGTGWMKVGEGFRVNEHAVTAYHNIGPAKQVALVKGDNVVYVDADNFMELAVDLGAVQLKPADWSKLGVPKASLGLLPNTIYVSATGVSEETSSGRLMASKHDFGQVHYFGSTRAGFSGAGYAAGSVVYGLHLRGGDQNGGLEAKFIEVCIRHSTGVVNESGDDPENYARRPNVTYYDLGDDALAIREQSGHYHLLSGEGKSKFLRKRSEIQNEIEIGLPSGLDEFDGRTWAEQMQMELDEIRESLRSSPRVINESALAESHASFSGEHQARFVGPTPQTKGPKSQVGSSNVSTRRGVPKEVQSYANALPSFLPQLSNAKIDEMVASLQAQKMSRTPPGGSKKPSATSDPPTAQPKQN